MMRQLAIVYNSLLPCSLRLNSYSQTIFAAKSCYANPPKLAVNVRINDLFIDKGIPVILGEYTAMRRDNLTGESLKLHQARAPIT